MLLNNAKTITNKYNGIMDGLTRKKEIFGELKDDYIAIYKTLTEHEDLANEDHAMNVYHVGDFDGVCHLFISVDTDFIQHEIVRGTYCISSPNGGHTDVEIEILMMTTPLQRHDGFLQIALENYLTEDISYEVMMDMHMPKTAPRWKKLAIVTDVAYAIALSYNVPNTVPLEAEYGCLVPLIRKIMQFGASPYTLDMANMMSREDLDEAYSAAVIKALKLKSTARQTNN